MDTSQTLSPIPVVVNAEPAAPTITPLPMKAAVIAFGNSASITGGAVVTGLAVNAYANGAHTVPQFASYFQSHVLTWAIANILAPAYRGFTGHRNAKAQHAQFRAPAR